MVLFNFKSTNHLSLTFFKRVFSKSLDSTKLFPNEKKKSLKYVKTFLLVIFFSGL